MAKMSLLAGTTSYIAQVFIQDSSSTTGAGLTGLVFNSASLTAYFHRDTDTTATAITLATMTVGTFTSSGFKEIDATNMPGWYQLCPPNTAIASGAKSVGIHLKGATNMAPLALEIELTAVNNQSATAFITGVNSLAPPSNWNVMSIDGSGRVDVIKVAGTTQTARDLGASVLLSTGTGTGQLDFTSGVVKANATQWVGGTIPAINVTGVPLVDLKYTLGTISPATAGSVRADSVTGAVGSVTGAVGSVTGNVGGNVVGSVASVTGAVGSVTGLTASDVGAIKTQTDKFVFTVANQVDSNVLDWKSSTAPAMTGDAFARLGAPAGASVSADVAAVKVDTAAIKVRTDLSPEGLKKNTALSNFEFFMALTSDHVTGGTGLAITATRSIDGAAFGACANSASEVSAGIYKINLAAADLNGDVVTLKFTAATADATLITIKTSP